MSNQPKKEKKWLKVLKFFAAYLVAAWTFLQFVDWILNRYNISPYWVDILLWLFIGIIPSLLIYLYHQERINKRILKRREKIIIPLNIILLFVVLYFGFSNSDLGATTKSIDYTDEQGEQQSALITKEEFRKGFYVFPFKPKEVDSSKTWLQYGINYLLTEDLLQNKNLSPKAAYINSTADKTREASYFYDYYVDGEFEIIDSTYSITTYLRDSKSANIIKEESFKGDDVLELIDDITVFVTNEFTSNEFNAPKYLDLEVKEFTSSSLKAIEYFMQSDYTKAVKEDNTFALAYLLDAKRRVHFNNSKFEERQLADKAYQYRSRLPLQKRGETLILKNLAYDEYENAEQLVKLQLEADPSDDTYNRLLYNIYGRTKNVKAYTERVYKAYNNEKNTENGFNAIEAGLMLEDYDYVLQQINLVELVQPNDDYVFHLKLRPLLHKGDINEAKKIQDKFKLLHPDYENLTKVYDTAIAYLKNNSSSIEKLKKFEGKYRSNHSEQTITYWLENNTLLQYYSNQTISVQLLAGDNKIVSGTPLGRWTGLREFFTDSNGDFYLFKYFQNEISNTDILWYWKIDNTIEKAEQLFEAKQLDSAKIAYEEAIEANPKHYYLKEVLAHINYAKSIDEETLQNQLKDVVGTYGEITVGIENNRLFYKRGNRIKIELLPISKNRYISSEMRLHIAFDYKDGKVINSYRYRYNIEKELWIKYDEEDTDLFLKDE